MDVTAEWVKANGMHNHCNVNHYVMLACVIQCNIKYFYCDKIFRRPNLGNTVDGTAEINLLILIVIIKSCVQPKIVDPSITYYNITLETVLRMMYLQNAFI